MNANLLMIQPSWQQPSMEQNRFLNIKVAKVFGMTVNLLKMKLIVTGYGITDEERVPIAVGGNLVECVEQFPYLHGLTSIIQWED